MERDGEKSDRDGEKGRDREGYIARKRVIERDRQR